MKRKQCQISKLTTTSKLGLYLLMLIVVYAAQPWLLVAVRRGSVVPVDPAGPSSGVVARRRPDPWAGQLQGSMLGNTVVGARAYMCGPGTTGAMGMYLDRSKITSPPPPPVMEGTVSSAKTRPTSTAALQP